MENLAEPSFPRPPTVVMSGRMEKKAEVLARVLLDDIVESGLEPGTMLPSEAVMLSQYPVGRTTLREALWILEVHGLLTIRAGSRGGPVVAAVDSRDFARMSSLFYRASRAKLGDLQEARMVIEPVAARLAAAHPDANDEHYQRLQKLAAQIEQSTEVDENQVFLTTSRELHSVVNLMGSNPILNLFSSSLVEMFVDRMDSFYYPTESRHEVNSQHLAIAKAILRGNGAAAERLMRKHMEHLNGYVLDGWSGSLNQIISWR